MRRDDVTYQLERFGLVFVWLAFITLFGYMRPDTFLTWSNFSTIFATLFTT
jgi:ribose transport system permease protein